MFCLFTVRKENYKTMKNKIFLTLLLVASLTSCYSYKITSVSGEMVKMDSTFQTGNTQLASMVQSYKIQLDEQMNHLIGVSSEFMGHGRPESLLTNFTSDVMKEYGDTYLPGGVDFSVMNVHGHRSTMPKGNIYVRNIYEIYSFDNALTYIDLKGTDVNKMFDTYARMGGAGISSNVRLEIENSKVKNVTIEGKPVDENKTYKIATLDYLANGNDNMSIFLDATKTLNTGITLRDIILDYIKSQTKQGKQITSKLDGRITVKK